MVKHYALLMPKLMAMTIAVAVASYSTVVSAQDEMLSNMSLKQRLERMENLLSPEMLTTQMQQLDAMRAEISLLREMLDQQGYELDTINRRQRSLYLDMDRRLQNLESGSPVSRTTAPVPPPVSAAGVSERLPDRSSGVSSDKDGKPAYDKAFNLLKEGQYQQAIAAFQSYQKTYPESKYADNAQYWLGEANYAYRAYKQSLNDFQELISRFPDSTKIPGARLKIGYVYYELKNWSAARDSLQQVVTLYPDTSMAKKAMERLDRMKREGY